MHDAHGAGRIAGCDYADLHQEAVANRPDIQRGAVVLFHHSDWVPNDVPHVFAVVSSLQRDGQEENLRSCNILHHKLPCRTVAVEDFTASSLNARDASAIGAPRHAPASWALNTRTTWFWLRFRDPGWLWSRGPAAARTADGVGASGGLGAVSVVVTIGAGGAVQAAGYVLPGRNPANWRVTWPLFCTVFSIISNSSSSNHDACELETRRGGQISRQKRPDSSPRTCHLPCKFTGIVAVAQTACGASSGQGPCWIWPLRSTSGGDCFADIGHNESAPAVFRVGWPGGVAPPGSLRTVRDSLPSHGSSYLVTR